MKAFDVQAEYWDAVADSKTFTHPLPMTVLQGLVSPAAKILDYGCGYARTCCELLEAGFQNVCGVDISTAMINRGRRGNPNMDLRTFDGNSVDYEDGAFDACLLMAVLTCIPSNRGQEIAIANVHRLLSAGGIALVSDYPLQTDARNLRRYQEYEQEFGVLGMFRTQGVVVRHHDMRWIHELLSEFEILWKQEIRVRTMNGHDSDVFQIIVRK